MGPKASSSDTSLLKCACAVLSMLPIIYLFHRNVVPISFSSLDSFPPTSATFRHHLLFSLASSNSTIFRREPYIRLWYAPQSVRAFVFLDRLPDSSNSQILEKLPPIIISKDSSRFPFTSKGGLRSAVRVARIVKEAVELNQSSVRWFIFGDDDTVFFVDNLVRLLSKYDHRKWYYIGSNSESYDQNAKESFEMAFGGGGIAISFPLAQALAKVLDSCLVRYGHLYGGDARVFSCLAELGVGLTREPGFHQVDLRGNLFGLLSSHPLSPILSLHHLELTEPIFPNMSRINAMEHLFNAVRIDPSRILQQTVCYSNHHTLTVSIAWGYSVQVFEGNKLLPELLSLQQSFYPWRRGRGRTNRYMFNVRDSATDKCKRPQIFFLNQVTSIDGLISSNYTRVDSSDCKSEKKLRNLKQILVSSKKLDLDPLEPPRRQCCDVQTLKNDSMKVSIRKCGSHELIAM